MPELKRSFTKGRMNRDLDERLVPNGEYRDALNIEVSTSEDSDVGAVQTVMGNININGLPGLSEHAVCVGQISNEKEDKLYWFITDPWRGKDIIAEYDHVTNSVNPVIVDNYAVSGSSTLYPSGGALNFDRDNLITGINIIDDMLFWTDNRSEPKKINITRCKAGSPDFNTHTQFLTKEFLSPVGNQLVKYPDGNVLGSGGGGWWQDSTVTNPKWILTGDGIVTGIYGINQYLFVGITNNLVTGKTYMAQVTIGANSTTGGNLDFHHALGGGKHVKIPTKVGTHIVYWTQGDVSWIKNQLTIYGHKAYTGTIDKIQLFEVDTSSPCPSGTLTSTGPFILEEHITVIKKSPETPPVLEMSQTPNAYYQDVVGSIGSVTTGQAISALGSAWWADHNGMMGFHAASPDSTYPTGVMTRSILLTGGIDLKIGDIVVLTNTDSEGDEKQIRGEVAYISVLTGNDSSGVPYPQGYFILKLIFLSVDPDIDAGDRNWTVVLEQEESLFQFKFPRFAYRYKYNDGEYSSFSPFTEVAFLPGRPNDEDFEYHPKKGFNLGMTNNLRHLALKNFIAEDDLLPDGVVEIDILYKESNSPSVYTVKTIKPTGVEWQTSVDGGGFKGYVNIRSEMIHAILPPNQILRPWDNVPRKALAQEMSGNRLIYGNYLQNYTVCSQNVEVSIKPRSLEGINGLPEELLPENAYKYLPAKSVKSLRTYQVGVVFRDKYGRETPVFSDNKKVAVAGKSSVYVDKKYAPQQNKLSVRLLNQPPDFAESFKFFVKETSNEYFNLALDRWYDAQDDNVWLSFPSSERNKVDEDTFLILKKEEDTNTFIEDPARYKILAIENDPPQYIREKNVIVGSVNDTSAKDAIGSNTSGVGFPKKDANIIWIKKAEFTSAGLADSDNVVTLENRTNIYVRVTGNNIVSDWYYIQSISYQTYAGDYFQISIEGIFGDDMSFTSTGGTYATRIPGLSVEIKEKIVENRPEFDGRFFVKIYKDAVLEEFVVKQDPLDQTLAIEREMDIAYIGPRWTGGGGNSDPKNQNNWADSEWYGWGYSDVQDVEYNDADEYWKKLGYEGNNLGLVIDNHEYQPCSHDSSNPGASWKRWFWKTSGITTSCHTCYWPKTGENYIYSLTDGAGNYERGSKFNRTNEATKGISRDHKDITITMPGTGYHEHKTYHTSGQLRGSWLSNRGRLNGTEYLGIDYSAYKTQNKPFKEFIDRVRQTGTLWRWADDPDQVVYKTISGGQSDKVKFTMVHNHEERGGGFIAGFCDKWSADKNRTVVAYANAPYGRRHIFTFKAEVAYGPNKGQAPGNVGFGYLPTNDPRNITITDSNGVTTAYPCYKWDGQGVPSGMLTGCVDAGATNLTNCTYDPNFNPLGYAAGIRSDGMKNGEKGKYGETIGVTKGSWKGSTTWQIVKPVSSGLDGDGGIKFSSTNPAIFETEPKEDVGLNIYHEVGQSYPVKFNEKTNEQFIPVGSVVTCWRDSGSAFVTANPTWNPSTGGYPGVGALGSSTNEPTPTGMIYLGGSQSNDITDPTDPWIPPIKVKSCELNTVTLVDARGNEFLNNQNWPQDHILPGDTLIFTRPDGSSTENYVLTTSTITPAVYTLNKNVWGNLIVLPWFNCYSFGNGVESDRIRDDFNQVTIDNGPKVSTTLDTPYEEERRSSGLIYSGIYNSKSGINNLNQFIQAEKITKDLNPEYGSIQKLHSRNTDLITLCEDKILKILANKDALYNADGNINLTATENVLGQSIPFVGEYGISKNPESFASQAYRIYFSDKSRGNILRLSQDGLTPISEFGMKDYFSDRLKISDRIIGSYDDKKSTYNITLTDKQFPAQVVAEEDHEIIPYVTLENAIPPNKTVSFSEKSKGWVSFKSFLQEGGISLNNDYFTFKWGLLWKHHENPFRSNFYGQQRRAFVTTMLNDAPGSVKSFQTLNYEGTQARITKDISAISSGQAYNDVEYYDNINKFGWWVELMTTNLQTGGSLEFKSKEDKWFSTVKGEATYWDDSGSAGNVDTEEFSVQGIGKASEIIHDVEVIYGCMDPLATNYDPTATIDDGSCVYPQGCTDNAACNYDPIAIVDDGSCCYISGCMDPNNCYYDPNACCGDPTDCCDTYGCTDPTATNYNINACCDDGSCTYIVGCTDASACNYDPNAVLDDGSCCYVSGCTDNTACNYDANACCDDGSCLFSGCTNPTASNYNPAFTADCGCVAGGTDYTCCSTCNVFNSSFSIDDFSGGTSNIHNGQNTIWHDPVTDWNTNGYIAPHFDARYAITGVAPQFSPLTTMMGTPSYGIPTTGIWQGFHSSLTLGLPGGTWNQGDVSQYPTAPKNVIGDDNTPGYAGPGTGGKWISGGVGMPGQLPVLAGPCVPGPGASTAGCKPNMPWMKPTPPPQIDASNEELILFSTYIPGISGPSVITADIIGSCGVYREVVLDPAVPYYRLRINISAGSSLGFEGRIVFGVPPVYWDYPNYPNDTIEVITAIDGTKWTNLLPHKHGPTITGANSWSTAVDYSHIPSSAHDVGHNEPSHLWHGSLGGEMYLQPGFYGTGYTGQYVITFPNVHYDHGSTDPYGPGTYSWHDTMLPSYTGNSFNQVRTFLTIDLRDGGGQAVRIDDVCIEESLWNHPSTI